MLEMDLKGNLYFHKNALLCKYEIIKRLTSGKYHLEEESPIGNLFTLIFHGPTIQRTTFFSECLSFDPSHEIHNSRVKLMPYFYKQ